MLRKLIFALLVVSSMALVSHWDQHTRDLILDIHNEYRRNEGACRMNKLEYDMELERQAKVWAEKCVFEHEMIDGRGENLAWDSNHNTEDYMLSYGAQRWFDEKNDYTWGQESCEPASCHYTQLVWDITEKVGCWSTRCPVLKYAWKDTYFLVCFYTPMGNWVGEQPYETTCKTPCRRNQTQEDGLCVGKALPDLLPCKDNKADCPRWAEVGQCEANPDWMKTNCVLSCTDCGGPKPEKKCEDSNPSCGAWAKRGECERSPAYMDKKCQKSCKKC